MTHPADDPDVDALYTLMYAARSLMHRLRAVTEDLHGQGRLSAGKRGVLMSLDAEGPRTVPQLARSRPVSRQHIQSLVNPLVREGYAELIPNPAHKRSKLVRLTARGKALVREMTRREARVFGGLDLPVSRDAMLEAGHTLDAVRALFEGPRWKAAVKKETAR